MSGDLKWAIENGDLEKVTDFIECQVFLLHPNKTSYGLL